MSKQRIDLDVLEDHLASGTPMPWWTSKQADAIILHNSTDPDSDNQESYGGVLVAESLSRNNRAIVITLRNAIPDLIVELRALRALEKAVRSRPYEVENALRELDKLGVAP